MAPTRRKAPAPASTLAERPAKRSRTRRKASTPGATTAPTPPPPQASPQLTQEAILEGIYQRMRRDGMLPTIQPPAAPSGQEPSSSTTSSSASASVAAPSATGTETGTSSYAGGDNSAAALNGAVATLLEGGSHTPGPNNFHKPSVLSSSIAAHVAPKIKEKIWAGRAINMEKLLPRFETWSDSDSDDDGQSKSQDKRSKHKSRPSLDNQGTRQSKSTLKLSI